MKKLFVLGLTIGLLGLSACSAYHAKQPVNETYYKRTQQVAWPESTVEKTGCPCQKKADCPCHKHGDCPCQKQAQ